MYLPSNQYQQVIQATISVLPSRTTTDLKGLQENNPALSAFLPFWQHQRMSSRAEKETLPMSARRKMQQWDRIHVVDGLLYRRIVRPEGGEEVQQIILPECLKEEVLQQLHQNHGHQGIERTTELVKQRCYWPGMGEDIKQCRRCAVAKSIQPQIRAPKRHLMAARPNQILAIDFSFVEPSRDGREQVLVMTDVFTKFTLATHTRPEGDHGGAGVGEGMVLPVWGSCTHSFRPRQKF